MQRLLFTAFFFFNVLNKAFFVTQLNLRAIYPFIQTKDKVNPTPFKNLSFCSLVYNYFYSIGRWKKNKTKKPPLRLSYDMTPEMFRVEGRLTVVTQQQTGLPVFVHINGCYKVHLQAEESQFSGIISTRSERSDTGGCF